VKTINVKYFAVLRERRGLSDEQARTDAETVAELRQELIARHRLGLPAALVRVAVGEEFVDGDHPLEDGMEVVLIPPVAGG
jgi:molybdopterin synthase sulfur carrier subunit